MATTIAVAGATGGVGKTIVEQILNEGKFPVIGLTRQEHVESPVSGVQYVQVDYEDIYALAQHLESHSVHTVICAIGMLGNECSEAQNNLIKAAEQTQTVQRFMPSEFGYVTFEQRRNIDPGVDWFLTAADLLKKSRLNFTRPVCGAFMDFVGIPHAKSNVPPMTIAVDVLNREACMPGDATNTITMIYSYDAATLVAKMLEVEDWPEFTFCNGEDTTLGKVLELAEEITGEKFKVTWMKPEDVSNGDVPSMTPLEGSGIQPEEQKAYGSFGYQLYLADGFKLPDEGRVGDKFPGFKPRSVREFMTSVWASRV
ncbi:hypothetical protein N7493_002291 [Penicillium malachiteum]|uniref:NAD(P)-binding domain-containing protein n=1 Tax=Penicillium malachiteum TaxID=1324776 RepID=A0AAD6HRY0_9EURO|nr:hypothetical protein N7493_002291 [Penicillium malachiteum]